MHALIPALEPFMNNTLRVHDAETARHCARVAERALQLGRASGLDKHDLLILGCAAYLHDIGKITIPQQILNKPGLLNAREWAVIQTHSAQGEALIRAQTDIPFADEIAHIVRHHHERWDGGGYPDGLREETIPLLSRILLVVDSYDAIVSNRPYRGAKQQSEALMTLTAASASKFDPTILHTFQTMQAETIAEDYCSPQLSIGNQAIIELA